MVFLTAGITASAYFAFYQYIAYRQQARNAFSEEDYEFRLRELTFQR
jgi:hypothetical protein